MTEKQEAALRLALDALDEFCELGAIIGPLEVRDALREALVDSALERMAENAREIGLDYGPIVERVEDSIGMGNGAWDMVEPKELAKAFHEALAEQPAQQQEPVAYIRKDQLQKAAQSPMLCEVTPEPRQDRIGIYTSPQPSKPWVGLTDEEKSDLWCESTGRDCVNEDTHVFADAIEAKLREKNA